MCGDQILRCLHYSSHVGKSFVDSALSENQSTASLKIKYSDLQPNPQDLDLKPMRIEGSETQSPDEELTALDDTLPKHIKPSAREAVLLLPWFTEPRMGDRKLSYLRNKVDISQKILALLFTEVDTSPLQKNHREEGPFSFNHILPLIEVSCKK